MPKHQIVIRESICEPFGGISGPREEAGWYIKAKVGEGEGRSSQGYPLGLRRCLMEPILTFSSITAFRTS